VELPRALQNVVSVRKQSCDSQRSEQEQVRPLVCEKYPVFSSALRHTFSATAVALMLPTLVG
jgi:hypothetical protein